MKKCEKCGIDIGDKYKYCEGCMNAYRNQQSPQPQNNVQNPRDFEKDIIRLLTEISEHLKHQNWNFGILTQTLTNNPKVVQKIQDEIKKGLNKSKSIKDETK